jgi:hypothetical protein
MADDTFVDQSDDQIGNSLPNPTCEADAKFYESHDSQITAKGLSDSSFLYVPNEDMSGQKVSSVNTPTEGFPVLSTEQLIIEQNKDSELSVLISKALSEDGMSCVPVCFMSIMVFSCVNGDMLNLNVINTPDRRKSQQLCHANMLKQYFERYSSTTDVVSLVTPVPLDIH